MFRNRRDIHRSFVFNSSGISGTLQDQIAFRFLLQAELQHSLDVILVLLLYSTLPLTASQSPCILWRLAAKATGTSQPGFARGIIPAPDLYALKAT